MGKDGKTRGRPVGVTFDPQRRVLYVADDLSNTVWRVAPRAGAPTPVVSNDVSGPAR
jgi:glucose/arabinose dehydrogenase